MVQILIGLKFGKENWDPLVSLELGKYLGIPIWDGPEADFGT